MSECAGPKLRLYSLGRRPTKVSGSTTRFAGPWRRARDCWESFQGSRRVNRSRSDLFRLEQVIDCIPSEFNQAIEQAASGPSVAGPLTSSTRGGAWIGVLMAVVEAAVAVDPALFRPREPRFPKMAPLAGRGGAMSVRPSGESLFSSHCTNNASGADTDRSRRGRWISPTSALPSALARK